MGDVQFDEPQYGSRMKSGSGPSKLAGFVIGLGLAKDNAGAQRVLLIIACVAFIALAFVWWHSSSSAAPAAPLPDPISS